MLNTKKYVVVRTGRLGGTFPRRGEITIHVHKSGEPSGAILFRCPACGGLQHARATVEGPDDAPTIRETLTCSCVRCKSTSFDVRAGKVYRATPKKVESPELGEASRSVGAFYRGRNGG